MSSTNYVPTPEKLISLGYHPDPVHTLTEWELLGFSRQWPAPFHPYTATLVVQVRSSDGQIFLHRYSEQSKDLWCYKVPTELFFEQLLSAIGWPQDAAGVTFIEA
ncbi:hypothetical protein [Hymenobacter sp. YC55]|uniref:hypothetical protein n=1 Tax=Hymenobacter sp. YC55 TaxID=3034019 RepID=UPI0023F65DFA|nr:hypothetical protein [Hymenobacter sp. YC55]MDF7809930.1 hypothetical protein [Hymenobacter sp. YC55]